MLLGHTFNVVIAGMALVPAVAVATSTTAAAAAPRFSCASTPNYTVASGDSWFRIASRAAVPANDLLEVNGATASTALTPGDVLCLPAGADAAAACAAGGRSYTVASGDSWYGIAARVGVSGAALLAANGATVGRTIRPGDVLCLPAGASAPSRGSGVVAAAGGGSYTVAAGDSWFGIASRAGVSTRALLRANDAVAAEVLVPGEVVRLPTGATTPAAGSGSGSGPASASAGSYTVRSGDSWFAIASRAGVSAGSLLRANDAGTGTVLVPGQTISLPAGADTKALAQRAVNNWVNLQAQPTQGPCWYSDTWMDHRSDGRRHEGVDIFTIRGQYVYAVVDGRLSSRSWDQPGRRSGNSWWLTAADGSATFFYAHMADFAPGLGVGSRVRAGEIIGFVGDSGNAAAVHLHFEIHPNGGEAVNPYPMVRAVGGCKSGTAYEQPGGWTPGPVG